MGEGRTIDLRSFRRFEIFVLSSTVCSLLVFVAVTGALNANAANHIGLRAQVIGSMWFVGVLGMPIYVPTMLAALIFGFPAWWYLVPRLKVRGLSHFLTLTLGACVVAGVAILPVGAFYAIGMTSGVITVDYLRFIAILLGIGAVCGTAVAQMVYRQRQSFED